MKSRVWLNTPNSNYSDRKKYRIDLEDYTSFILYEENNINFNYGDMINTSCVSDCPIDLYGKQPNYMLLFDVDKSGNRTLESRWFVLESVYQSSRQVNNTVFTTWEMSLYRDVIVDNRQLFIDNNVKIDKGYLKNSYDNINILNSETLDLNQVKIDQIEIQDEFKDIRWATFFYTGGSQDTITFDGLFPTDITMDNLRESDWIQLNPISIQDNNIKYTNYSDLNLIAYSRIGQIKYSFKIILRGTTPIFTETGDVQLDFYHNPTYPEFSRCEWKINETYPLYMEKFYSEGIFELSSIFKKCSKIIGEQLGLVEDTYEVPGRGHYEEFKIFREIYNNSYIKGDNNLDIYKINCDNLKIFKSDYAQLQLDLPFSEEDENRIVRIIEKFVFDNQTWYINGNSFSFNDTFIESITSVNIQDAIVFDSKPDTAILGEQIQSQAIINLPTTTQLSEINCFAITIPFTDTIDGISIDQKQLNKTSIYSMLTEGYTSLGDQALDVQILPYCPQREILQGYTAVDKNINTSAIPSIKVPITVTEGSITREIYSAFIVQLSSSEITVSVTDDKNILQPTEIKKASMANFCRLMAPNHGSAFEFKPTSNFGCDNFILEWTIKPLKTFYRCSPVFKEGSLYGGNYNDSRGLQFEGGFSVANISNAWVNYQLQNSTYQQMFNTDIHNLEINNQVAQQKELLSNELQRRQGVNQNISAGIGAVTSVAGGAAAGFASGGGPVGAVVGGIAGGIHGVVNAGLTASNVNLTNQYNKDVTAQNDILRAQSEQYKTQQFNLTNQAIKAQPNTLSSSSDFNINTNPKIYIELYSCTSPEWDMIDNYLYYNGHSIQRTGRLANYIDVEKESYVKGSLLFAPGLSTHETNAINQEFASGFFVQPNFIKEN